ncbi:hypothetical protein V6L77_08495 [Pannonibacter sp. Pt2-lr]
MLGGYGGLAFEGVADDPNFIVLTGRALSAEDHLAGDASEPQILPQWKPKPPPVLPASSLPQATPAPPSPAAWILRAFCRIEPFCFPKQKKRPGGRF